MGCERMADLNGIHYLIWSWVTGTEQWLGSKQPFLAFTSQSLLRLIQRCLTGYMWRPVLILF